MATVLSEGDLLSVRLNFGLQGELDTAMNVLYYRVQSVSGTPPSIAQVMSSIAVEMFDVWSPAWRPSASTLAEFKGVTVTSVFPLPRSVSLTYTPPAPVFGQVVGEPLPLQDSVTILKKTDFGARWGLGRLFYAGLPETSQNKGVLTEDAAATLTNMVVAVSQTVALALGNWSVSLEPVLKRGPDDNPISITRIRSGQISNTILKTQRRRRPGKGS